MKTTRREMRKKVENVKSVEDDSRFADVISNPMFNEIPKKHRKVVIDERFQQIFKDDNFKAGHLKLDKRGRKLNLRDDDDQLLNLYTVDSDKEKKDSDESDADETDDDEDELLDVNIQVDLARGEGNVSSSDDDESEDDEEKEELDEDETIASLMGTNSWGELDRGAKRVEWASRRIAICNLEWDRLKAEDLMIVLNSSKPEGGKVESVAIYLSDFGAENMEEENVKGPKLPDLKDAKNEKDEKIISEAIRAYQLKRLKYFYAVCVCDTEETAMKIYESCDGVEYEMSGVRFDIRFIPDEMEFDSLTNFLKEFRVRERVTFDDFVAENYKPKRFESSTMSNVDPKLTWDETDPERTKLLKESFKGDANFDEFCNVIAPPSDSEDEDETAKRKRLELLIGGGNSEEDNSDEENGKEEMRVEWDVPKDDESDKMSGDEESGFKDELGRPMKRGEKKMTKYQLYLERRKLKRKERKAQELEAKKQRKEEAIADSDEERRMPLRKRQKIAGSVADAPEDDGSAVAQDGRFSALFTDSAFAIDRTHSHYKGSRLAERQVQEKSAKRKSTKTGREAPPPVMNVDQDEGGGGVESTNEMVEKIKKRVGNMKKVVKN